MQNFPTKTDGVDSLSASEFNNLAVELENLITASGQTLNSGDANQIGRSASIYAHGGSTYTDSGSVNTYVLNVIGSKIPPSAYFDGMRVIWKAGNNQTGASTINVAGIGVKNLVNPDGTALASASFAAGDYCEAIYNLANDRFELRRVSILNATTSLAGKVQLATTAEVAAGVDAGKVSSVANMVYHQGIAKAFVNYNQATNTINDSYNVSSVSDTAVGRFGINFTTAMANNSYIAVGNGAGSSSLVSIESFSTNTANMFGTNSTSGSLSDFTALVAIFGDR